MSAERAYAVDAIELAGLRIDGGTQPRAEISQSAWQDYAACMESGAAFPPIVVFFDGVDHWLADGFHRYHAARSIGREHLPAELRNGTRRDAVLFSVGANSAHGMQRTNADKRKAVETLMADPEWSKWSAHEIARQCGVAQSFVSRMRGGNGNGAPSLNSEISEPRPNVVRYVNRHGKEAEMNVAAIGRDPKPTAEPAVSRSKRDAAIAAIKADPCASSKVLAARVGCSGDFIGRIRVELGMPASSLFQHQGIKRRADKFDETMNSLQGFVLGFASIGAEDFASDPRAKRWAEQVTELIAGLSRLRSKIDGGKK
jgi:hypothetical protein